ncbi:MAG TPA: diaminopimelate decarboxylase [Gemmatimonadaceae bacterium]|nr:diaminopimelate decarboxylase [Gemmatimonadaceae bacterium]
MGQGVLTAGFQRAAGSGGTLMCEGVALERIADEVGTPVYVYSAGVIRDRYEKLDATLASVPHRVHYTLKANGNVAILKLLHGLGAGADVVSGGELLRAQRAGYVGRDIVFGGVGKTDDELRDAIAARVLLVNAESAAEIERLDTMARAAGATVPVGIRVNPELNLHAAHEYIKTGEKGHKFGIPYDDALHVAKAAAKMKNVALVGLDMHLGSQLSRIEPYRAGTERLAKLVESLRKAGITTLEHLDIGGGLGVRYDDETPPDLERFAKLVLPVVKETGLSLIMEPGRFIVGNAGVLVATVLYRKKSGGKEYVITDAGMTELLRPSHYGAFHRIEAARDHDRRITADVVGPVCESGDFLALDRKLADVQPGERIVVFDVGAYGYAMASNYNARRRAAEVLVDGDKYAITTRRETYEDLMRLDVDEPTWRSG